MSTTGKTPITRIGRYDVLSTIGSGGMACVYRARIGGPAGASKQVALKVIHGHLAEDRDFVLMFLDEMRLAMALSHRNIVQTFDAGHVDERYFMVMELIDGCSLRGLLNGLEGEFPVDTALFIGREVAAALAYAHRFTGHGGQGVIHRDVSPSNILLSAEGDVKLADFGVAKAAGRLYVSSANLIRGKMQYMSPEQAAGEAEAASDLFALGSVLYELLTGQPTRRPVGLDDLLLTARPPRPSLLRSGLPKGLDELLLACLDPEPRGRPATAEEVRRVLAAAALELQLKDSLGMDPHARLARVLEAQGERTRERAQAETPKPERRVARAVLAQVRAMETDPEIERPEATEPASFSGGGPTPLALDETQPASYSGDPPTPVVNGLPDDETMAETRILTRPTPPPRRAARSLALGGALVLALGAGIFLWLSSSEETGAPGDAALGAKLLPDQHSPDQHSPDQALDRDRAPRRDLASPDAPIPDRAAPDARRAPDPRRRPHPRPPRPAGFGYVDINSVPWAKVYIDGRLHGETPLQRVRLRAGIHHVELVSPTRKLFRRYTVKVAAGKQSSHVFELRRAE
jgi:serine/threonine protein kinase